MESISETIAHHIATYGRIHWLLENTEADETRLVEALERFRVEHPLSSLPIEDGEMLIAYHPRPGGWAIEALAQQDLATNGAQRESRPRHILSARVGAAHATASGTIALMLTPLAPAATQLLEELVYDLTQHFPEMTVRNLLGEQHGVAGSIRDEDWTDSHIHELFNLPVGGLWLAALIKDKADGLEALGPLLVPGGHLLYHAPVLTREEDQIWITWRCKLAESGQLVGAMQWRIHDQPQGGVIVEAFCRTEPFRVYYYNIKTAVRDVSRRQAARPKLEADAGHPNAKLSGRPTLLCNYWAYAQSVLGHSTESILAGWVELYKWETGRDAAELAEPLDSLKKGMAAIARKHRKK